jgi:protein-disulfide isomerase
MKRFMLLAAVAALVAPPAAAAPARHPAPAARRTPAARDWTRTVVATPLGGFRMGNPAARVKLVEYGSLSCPHCALFSREGGPPLRAYVKTGRVSWEFRPYILFSSDPGVSMLLRCRGPVAFFDLADRLYAEQGVWMGRLRQMPAEEQDRVQAMSVQEQVGALARLSGVDQFFRAHGLTEPRIAACLADAAALRALAAGTERANSEGVRGTPTFFINGRVVDDAATWDALEPAIRRAGG